MSEEKLHNEDFDVIRVDGNVLSGDSNKIKLKMISYAVVMEVQEAFFEEELEKQKEELYKLEAGVANTALTEEEKTIINENVESLSGQIESLNKVYEEFSNAHQRFMEVAKKALKVHEENIKQMKENDRELAEEPKMSVDFSEYKKAQKVLEDAQNANIFSTVDRDAIKEEVNRLMDDKDESLKEESTNYENNGDFITKNITSDNFENVVKTTATDVKDNLIEQENEKISKANIEADLDKYLGGATSTDDKDKDEERKPYHPHVGPFQTNEETKKPVENNGPIFDQEQPIEPEYDLPTPPQKQNNNETERKYTTSGKSSTTVNFDGDTSFKQFLTSRQEGLNEKNRKVSNLRTEVGSLEKTAKDKKKRIDEETRKSEERAADMASIAKQLEELKRLDEEENKLNKEETTLTDRKTELNSEISGYDAQIDEIEKRNAADLEKYRAMQEELNKYLEKYSDNYTNDEEEKGLPRNVLR